MALRRSMWYFDTMRDLSGLFWAGRLPEIVLATFSIYAEVALWRVRAVAVKIVKRYLLAFLAYVIVAPLFPLRTV